MPKLIDYGRSFVDYFTKNYGLNSVTSALVPAIVQSVSIGDPALAQTIAGSFDADTVAVIQHGGAGMFAALTMIVMRVALAVLRS